MASSEHIHHYRTRLVWDGSTAVGYDRYARAHVGSTEPATVDLELASDPAFLGDPSKLNPEQLLVLAASSCQLLSFLAVAARARLDVVSYRDEAAAVMPEGDHPVRITRITLRPHIVVAVAAAQSAPSNARVERLVDLAHHECYIANSLRSDIVVEPTIAFITASTALS